MSEKESPESNISFFNASVENFHTTLKNSELFKKTIDVYGYTIEILFSGVEGLRRLWPAISHLESVDIDNPDFLIHAWDSFTSRTNMIPMPWERSDIYKLGYVRGFNNQSFETSFIYEPTGFSMVDKINSKALFWVDNYQDLPKYVEAAPFKSIFQSWFRGKQIHYTHGACIGSDNACILLAAKGGSGKSTTAITCAAKGLQYLSDDYCLTRNTPTPSVSSVYSSAKLTYDAWDRWPDLRNYFSGMKPCYSDKIYFSLYPERKEIFNKSLPLKAIVVPNFVSSKTKKSFEKISASAALKAIAPSSIFQLSGGSSMDFYHFSSLVRNVPSFNFNLSQDLELNVERIKDFMSDF
jgi:hypothetical protein